MTDYSPTPDTRPVSPRATPRKRWRAGAWTLVGVMAVAGGAAAYSWHEDEMSVAYDQGWDDSSAAAARADTSSDGPATADGQGVVPNLDAEPVEAEDRCNISSGVDGVRYGSRTVSDRDDLPRLVTIHGDCSIDEAEAWYRAAKITVGGKMPVVDYTMCAMDACIAYPNWRPEYTAKG